MGHNFHSISNIMGNDNLSVNTMSDTIMEFILGLGFVIFGCTLIAICYIVKLIKGIVKWIMRKN
jgi:hypothetical protein